MGNDQSKICKPRQQTGQSINQVHSTTDERSFFKSNQTIIVRANQRSGSVVSLKRQRSYEVEDRTPPKRRCQENRTSQRLPTCHGQSDEYHLKLIDEPSRHALSCEMEASDLPASKAEIRAQHRDRAVTALSVPLPEGTDQDGFAKLLGQSPDSASDSDETIAGNESPSQIAKQEDKRPLERRDAKQALIASQRAPIALLRKAAAYMRAKQKTHGKEPGTEFPLNGVGLWPGAQTVQRHNSSYDGQPELRRYIFRQPTADACGEKNWVLPALFVASSARNAKIYLRSVDSVGRPKKRLDEERRQSRLSGI